MSTIKASILDVMKQRPIIGDGSFTFTLEKRGYIKAGSWIPRAVIEAPDAVSMLHREFQSAGADVLQVYSFYSSDDRLKIYDTVYKSADLNQKACEILAKVAKPDNYICGGISPTDLYTKGSSKKDVKDQFRIQCDVFDKNNVDFVLGEFFPSVEEACWSIEVMRELKVPVACTLRIGPTGDIKDVSPQECAVRMARAGADIIGINCQYDPKICIKTIKLMKKGLEEAGLSAFLMLQPVCFHVPETENMKGGYHQLPEFPFCLEPRLLTRMDCRRYAREAYEAGVRYIGGCCGFEPYHIREMAEELAPEIGHRPPGKDKNGMFGEDLQFSSTSNVRERKGRVYWMDITPATGRPESSSVAVPIGTKYAY